MNPAWATLAMAGTMGVVLGVIGFWLIHRDRKQAGRDRERTTRQS